MVLIVLRACCYFPAVTNNLNEVQNILSHPTLKPLFTAHAQRALCIEMVLYWDDVQPLLALQSTNGTATLAQLPSPANATRTLSPAQSPVKEDRALPPASPAAQAYQSSVAASPTFGSPSLPSAALTTKTIGNNTTSFLFGSTHPGAFGGDTNTTTIDIVTAGLSLSEPLALLAVLNAMAEKYIKENSPFQVNISDTARRKFEKLLKGTSRLMSCAC